MGVRFTGPDLVALALEIERNGAAFYEACLAKDTGEQAARVFRFMLGEERKHVQQFQELETLLQGTEALGVPMSDEEQQYLTALATSNIFTAEGTGDEMAEVGKARCEGGAVVEDEFGSSLPLGDGFLEGLILLPEADGILLLFGKVDLGIHVFIHDGPPGKCPGSMP